MPPASLFTGGRIQGLVHRSAFRGIRTFPEVGRVAPRRTPVRTHFDSVRFIRADDDADEAHGSTRRLFARPFAVFAAEQVDGVDDLVARRTVTRDAPARLTAADEYFRSVGARSVGARVIEGGNQAYYRPATDSIHVPPLDRFDEAAHFYSTLAHDPSTGPAPPSAWPAPSVDGSVTRRTPPKNSSPNSAPPCGAPKPASPRRPAPDHAAYLAGSLRILRRDARALVTVASKAQAAVDYLNALADHDPTSTTESAPDEAA
jgi:antirestriction protein ArdC